MAALFVTLFIVGVVSLPLYLIGRGGQHLLERRQRARLAARERLALDTEAQTGPSLTREDARGDAALIEVIAPLVTLRDDALTLSFRRREVSCVFEGRTHTLSCDRGVVFDAMISPEAWRALNAIVSAHMLALDALELTEDTVRLTCTQESMIAQALPEEARDALLAWLETHGQITQTWRELLVAQMCDPLGRVSHARERALLLFLHTERAPITDEEHDALVQTLAAWKLTAPHALFRRHAAQLCALLPPEDILARCRVMKAEIPAHEPTRWGWLSETLGEVGVLLMVRGEMLDDERRAPNDPGVVHELMDRKYPDVLGSIGALLASVLAVNRRADPNGMMQLIHGLAQHTGPAFVEAALHTALRALFAVRAKEDSRLRGVLFGLEFCAGPHTVSLLHNELERSAARRGELRYHEMSQHLKRIQRNVSRRLRGGEVFTGALSVAAPVEQAGALTVAREAGMLSLEPAPGRGHEDHDV